MKKSLFTLFASIIAHSTLVYSQTPIQMPLGPGRIAISHDGNNWDEDDIYSFAMDYAILTAFGMQSKLVHMEHSTIWANDTIFYREMKKSAEAINRFPGFNKTHQFDCQIPSQVTDGKANFKTQAEKSSATDLLYFILAGPMDIPYHDIEAVSKEYRKFIVCISHSNANEKMGVGTGRKGWANIISDFTADGVQFKKIPDQSSFLGGIGSSKWDFLTTMPANQFMPPEACAWLRTRDFKGNGDASDSKMLWYAITSRTEGYLENFKAAFSSPMAPGIVGTTAKRAGSMLSPNVQVSFSQNSKALHVLASGMQGAGMVDIYNGVSQKIGYAPIIGGQAQLNLEGASRGKYFLSIKSTSQQVVKEFLIQ